MPQCPYCHKREIPKGNRRTCGRPDCQRKHHLAHMKLYWHETYRVYVVKRAMVKIPHVGYP